MEMSMFLNVGAGLVIVSALLKINLVFSLALLLGPVVKVRLKSSPGSVMLNISIKNRTVQPRPC